MDLNTILEFIVNNGIGVAVIIYFCIRDWKFQDTLVKALGTLTDQTERLSKILDRKEEEKND